MFTTRSFLLCCDLHQTGFVIPGSVLPSARFDHPCQSAWQWTPVLPAVRSGHPCRPFGSGHRSSARDPFTSLIASACIGKATPLTDHRRRHKGLIRTHGLHRKKMTVPAVVKLAAELLMEGMLIIHVTPARAVRSRLAAERSSEWQREVPCSPRGQECATIGGKQPYIIPRCHYGQWSVRQVSRRDAVPSINVLL